MKSPLSRRARLCLASVLASVLTAVAAPTEPVRIAQSRFHRQVSIEPTRTSVADAIRWLGTAGGIRIRVFWEEPGSAAGLAEHSEVRLEADRAPMIRVLESIIRQADAGEGGGATWQMNEQGEIEVGPRSRLNERRELRVYDVHDLLVGVPDFTQGATLDLQAALSARSGGSVLSDDTGPAQLGSETRDLRAEDLIDVICQTVEPGQWEAQGGTGGTIRAYRGQLIVVAAPYVHRQLLSRIR